MLFHFLLDPDPCESGSTTLDLPHTAYTYVVRWVGVGPALQEEGDGGEAGKHADGVAAHARGLPGAGQVEGGAPPLTPRLHSHKVVHRLLHLKHLHIREIQKYYYLKQSSEGWEESFCNTGTGTIGKK